MNRPITELIGQKVLVNFEKKEGTNAVKKESSPPLTEYEAYGEQK